MNPMVFISQNDDTGRGAAKTIYDHVTSQPSDIDAFLSTSLPAGVDFVQAIIEDLPCTDLQFFVIDQKTKNSKWMKWEHDFCKKRDIQTIYIKYPNVNLNNPSLEYINRQSVWVIYDEYRNDILIDKIEKTIVDHHEKINQRSKTRASITIHPDQDQLCGRQSESVTISGRIYGHMHNGGRVYLHVPSPDPSIPPNSTATHTFTIGADGRFSCELDMSGVFSGSASRVCYVEIRAEPAACVVPLRVDTGEPPAPQDAAPSDPRSPGVGDGDAEQMPGQMRRYSEGVLKATPRNVDGREFPRSQVGEIISLLDREDRIVLTGDKGSGKSVILCQLYEKLTGSRRVLLVRCDDFLQYSSLDDLDRTIGGGASILDYLSDARGGRAKTVLLFDSLDAVSRNSKSMSLFRQFIQGAWSAGNVQTVCTVRTYDYEYSPEIGSVEWGFHVVAGDLPEEIINGELERIGNRTVPDELKGILRNPLRLKLFHMIASKNPGANFANVKNEVRLYQEHWKEYVDRSDRRSEATAALLGVARRMIESRRTAILRHEVGGPADGGLDSACSSGILAISGDHVRFFHHAYLDYVASKGILRDHPNTVAFLEDNRYNAFLLPTLAFALSLMHDGGRSEYLETVISICESKLPYYWRIAAVRSLAELDGFSAEEIDPIGRLLDGDHALQRHFLLEAGLAKNPFWLRVWSKRRMEVWSAQDYNASMMIGYFESLSGHKPLHGRIIQLMRLIIGNENIHPLMRQKAVEATAGMSDPLKASWYLELSRHPDARVRVGVLPCLEGLLDAGEEADRAAEAFANVASYQEASRESTPFVPYGTSKLVSNKMQDNAHAVWAAGEVFPALLAKRPAEMIGAAIRSLESAWPERRGPYGIGEDHSRMWYGRPNPSDHAKIVESIAKVMPNLLAEDAPRFAQILAASRPAVFHRILLDAMAAQPCRFAGMICEELSRPGVLVLPSLRDSARESIRLVAPHLSRPQAEALLAGVMALEYPERPSAGALISYYLSAFDRSALSPEHLDVLKRWPPSPSPSPSHGRSEAPHLPLPPPPPSPEQAVRLLSEAADMGWEVGHTIDLGLLGHTVGHAGGDTGGLDDGLAIRMRSLFLRLAVHPDPGADAPRREAGGGGGGLAVRPTARGLAARGLIRLCARTRDKSLLPAIESLSRGNVAVRSSVAEELDLLFGVDDGLARRIAVRYSADADRRVVYRLTNVINLLAKDYPNDALAAVRNILKRREAAAALAEYLPHALLFLALSAKLLGAWDLLQNALEDASLPTEIRRGMPYALKEAYLFYPATQDRALDIFSRLLDSEEPQVREAASFFLLSTIGHKGTGNATALIGKMDAHLGKIAREADARPYNPQIVGTLVGFLRGHWRRMPKRALDWLERISAMPYAAYQPAFMEGTVATLNEMFRSMPAEGDRNRCLSILDSFVKAGWPKAMDLLREMGRPD